jgi:hypothetical protein
MRIEILLWLEYLTTYYGHSGDLNKIVHHPPRKNYVTFNPKEYFTSSLSFPFILYIF